MFIFDSAVPAIKLPPQPANWPILDGADWTASGTARRPWLNLRQALMPYADAVPQGEPYQPGDAVLASYEPEPITLAGPGLTANAAWMAQRFPGSVVVHYGSVPITAAQGGTPADRAREEAILSALDGAYRVMTQLGCTVCLDLSMAKGQTPAAYAQACKDRGDRFVRFLRGYGLKGAVTIGARKVGGDDYLKTAAHSRAEMAEVYARMLDLAYRIEGATGEPAVCGFFAHHATQKFADEAGRAMAAIAGEAPATAAAVVVKAQGAGKVTKDRIRWKRP